jgi:hypothetical protein
MNILICGDSFAADWSLKDNSYAGWPTILSKYYNIKNNAQAGCSEYKIYNQLISENLNNFDCVIISHTSPYRIPIEKHPALYNDKLHKNADLIYSDIKSKNDPKLAPIIDFFENYFHIEYAEFIHKLIIKEQQQILFGIPVLHLSYYRSDFLSSLEHNLCFEKIFKKNKGYINHMSKLGNQKIANAVHAWINNLV